MTINLENIKDKCYCWTEMFKADNLTYNYFKKSKNAEAYLRNGCIYSWYANF